MKSSSSSTSGAIFDCGALWVRSFCVRGANEDHTGTMPTYRVAGINVQFPYDAYDCQLVYMERVISSLQQVWINA